MKLLIILSFFLSGPAWGQELVEKTIAVTVTDTEIGAARRKLQEQAVEKITAETARDLMGSERFEKSQSTVLSKITKMSGRYIPYVKPGEMKSNGDTYEMNFVMRISPLNLRILLQNAGLLNENVTSPVVLPLVSFYDRVGMGTFKWWQPGDTGSKRFLISQTKQLETFLKDAFKKNQFHVIRPLEISAAQVLPSVFQTDRISPEDRQFLGQLFQAPLVIDGQIEFSKSSQAANLYSIDIKLVAIQLSNNRVIADVSRKYETETGLFEGAVEKKMKQVMETTSQDLAIQVFEAWQRGSVGTNIIRLTINGEISLPQREALKEKIRTQIPQIRNIRERLVGAKSISFEVDSSASSQDLGKKLVQVEFNGMKFQGASTSEKEVVVDLR